MSDDLTRRVDQLHGRVSAVEQTQAAMAATQNVLAEIQKKHADYLLDPKDGLAVRQALVEQLVRTGLDRRNTWLANSGLIAAAVIGSLATWWLAWMHPVVG